MNNKCAFQRLVRKVYGNILGKRILLGIRSVDELTSYFFVLVFYVILNSQECDRIWITLSSHSEDTDILIVSKNSFDPEMCEGP